MVTGTPNWKAVIVGLALSAALPIAVFLIFNVNNRTDEPPNIFAVLGAWLLALFLPSFCAGWLAKRRGWLYGGALALLPIVFAALVGYEVPIALVIVLWAVGLVGGAVGEALGKRRHAL